jgi:hypothetical protein
VEGGGVEKAEASERELGKAGHKKSTIKDPRDVADSLVNVDLGLKLARLEVHRRDVAMSGGKGEMSEKGPKCQ